MNRASIKIIFALFLVVLSCKNTWEEHFDQPPATVNMNLWDAMREDPRISMFVDALAEFEYDSLFDSDKTYTLFIPENEAFSLYKDTVVITNSLLDFHISRHFIQSGSITDSKQIQTFSEKYALFERNSNAALFDGIASKFESPLYLNGKYFILEDVALPKPSLYEYIAATNETLKKFIDSQDSVLLDKELSIPIGFDENGNTIYDTVAIVINEFEEEFFPISKEFRNKTATLVFPREENYLGALDEMANQLGDLYQDHEDIPIRWQYDILIPYLLEHGVFQNSLEEIEFEESGLAGDTLKLKNIIGDSIIIDYIPTDQTVCSNGYAYNIADFKVPDTLFNGATRFEGEWLLDIAGINKYEWVENVVVSGSSIFAPKIIPSQNFSNDSALSVGMTLGYKGTYSVEFNVKNLFPRKYLMIVRTSMTTGGIFSVYFNDVLVKTINSYEFVLNPFNYLSVTGKFYKPKNGYIRYDCWVYNESEYGKAKIKFEYGGPANMPSNGLVFDYIDFIPYPE